jgi:RNA polymerase-binding transcription factor DksA
MGSTSTRRSMMPDQERSTAAATPVLDGPQWRALLEARWQARLEDLTELSLAYHSAAEAIVDAWVDETVQRQAQLLLRQAVAARRKLADVEEALARLAAGRYGRCEQCESAIPAGLLALIPEARYCPRCDAEPARPVVTTPARR